MSSRGQSPACSSTGAAAERVREVAWRIITMSRSPGPVEFGSVITKWPYELGCTNQPSGMSMRNGAPIVRRGMAGRHRLELEVEQHHVRPKERCPGVRRAPPRGRGARWPRGRSPEPRCSQACRSARSPRCPRPPPQRPSPAHLSARSLTSCRRHCYCTLRRPGGRRRRWTPPAQVVWAHGSSDLPTVAAVVVWNHVGRPR